MKYYQHDHPQLIRKPDVVKQTGLSKSTIYNRVNDGLFPPPINLGARAVAFLVSEVDAVINAMIEERSEEDIKSLVRDLIKQRKRNLKPQKNN